MRVDQTSKLYRIQLVIPRTTTRVLLQDVSHVNTEAQSCDVLQVKRKDFAAFGKLPA